MPCKITPCAIICFSPCHKLRLADGRRIFMEFHNYLGPMFYLDKNHSRHLYEWYEDPLIVDQLNWFIRRGFRS